MVGAVLRFSSILDVSTQSGIEAFRLAYQSLQASGVPLRKNRRSAPTDTDIIVRALDRQVFKYLHEMFADQGLPPVDAVRGAFPQGDAVAPTSAIFANSHVQIALRNPRCVLGWFRVPELAAAS